ncbi:MAG: SpoIIE family protein phosphatase [Treponema sp.]|nr:SpoIIE family protein phosphatase [Treponema sp.]
MALDDSFAHLPLYGVAALSLILLVLVSAIKKKGSARISSVMYMSLVILFVSSLAGAFIKQHEEPGTIGNSFIVFSVGVLAAAVLSIPYCVMLLTFEPKEIRKLVPRSGNRKLEEADRLRQKEESQAGADASGAYDTKILELSREFMLEASKSYEGEDGMQGLLDNINKTIMEQIKADGGAILMVDDFEDLVTVKAFEGDFPPPYKLPNDMPHKPVRVATNFKFASFPLRDNIFGEVASSGVAELITNPNADTRIYQNGPEEFLECGSYIVVPMKIQDTVIGVTAFARKHGAELFSNGDLRIAMTLSDFAAAAIRNVVMVSDIIETSKQKKETEISGNIQNLLKPAKLPVIPGIQISMIWSPAAGVCGDCYDVIVSRKDRVSFMLTDIAGKGINSTMIMVMVRSMLRLVVNTTQSAAKILTWVNKGICGESFSSDHFGSAMLMNYNPETKEIQFSVGGSIPVYRYDSEAGSFSQISVNDEPIGVEKATEYKDYVQKLNSGDIIVAYTDGVVETLNEGGQPYSSESLLKLIGANHDKSSKDLTKLVKDDIKKFSGSAAQHDDETLLLFKVS